jgi:hypothetical protein
MAKLTRHLLKQPFKLSSIANLFRSLAWTDPTPVELIQGRRDLDSALRTIHKTPATESTTDPRRPHDDDSGAPAGGDVE